MAILVGLPQSTSLGQEGFLSNSTVIEMDKQDFLQFRLSKGDGIEFKRNFTKIRKVFEEFIVKAPIMWSLAIHSESLSGV